MQQIRHTAGALRYLIDGPAGLLEFRITPNLAALIHHEPACGGDGCHCDFLAQVGEEIAIAYRLGGDDAVWQELNIQAVAAEVYTIPQPIHEATADERGFAAVLRAEGQQMVDEGRFRTGQEN